VSRSGAVGAQIAQATPPARVTPPLAPAQPAKPKGFVQVPVLAVFDETADIRTIRMARPDGFEFSAGQFIAVRVRVDGKDCSRCYSVSSAPDVRGYFEISVKRQGLVSNALHVVARPGALMSVRSPNGAFKYPSGDDRPMVLVAGGVGITPLISMLRQAIHTEPSRPVTLLYSARTEATSHFAMSWRHWLDGIRKSGPPSRRVGHPAPTSIRGESMRPSSEPRCRISRIRSVSSVPAR
jgi:ferredoxin-NADP reductase